LEEAARLLQVSEMRGVEYQPAKDGFVFSTIEIHAAIDREQRRRRGAVTDIGKYRPGKFHTVAERAS
jgi:hypothetical protein